jgi:hypothetical protein
MNRLTGKRALITGGSTGIGTAPRVIIIGGGFTHRNVFDRSYAPYPALLISTCTHLHSLAKTSIKNRGAILLPL